MTRTYSLDSIASEGNKQERAARRVSEQATITTDVLRLAKSLGIVSDLLGREFAVYDASGTLKYIVHQRPLNVAQLTGLAHDARIMAAQDFLREAEETAKLKKRKR